MKQYATVGLAVLAGAAVFEAALIPGLVIGGAAVLAPSYMPKLRRRLQTFFNSAARPRSEPKAARRQQTQNAAPAGVLARLGIGKAVAKTVTFRIIVTTLDFTTNYIVIGELVTAAGLSTFNLIVGPLFYLGHETAWNYVVPGEETVELRRLLPFPQNAKSSQASGLTVSRAVAKTITFRTIATVMDFTVNYVVVRDVITAAGLSAFAFFVGPFVYLGHEKLWNYYGPTATDNSDLKSLPQSWTPLKLIRDHTTGIS